MKRNSSKTPKRQRLAHACSDARAMIAYDKDTIIPALKKMAIKYRIPYTELIKVYPTKKYTPTEKHYRELLIKDKEAEGVTKKYFSKKGKVSRYKHKDMEE